MIDTTQSEALHGVLYRAERALRLIRKPAPAADTLAEVELLLTDTVTGLRQVLGIKQWPEPTSDPPDMETLQEWFFDSVCEATDSCIVEHDGVCQHGHPSWFLRLGLI